MANEEDDGPCPVCDSSTCPGAPRFKGLCRLYARSITESVPIRSSAAPFEFERARLEKGQRKTLRTPTARVLYRALKIRFDPLSRDVLVHGVQIGHSGHSRQNFLLAPTSAYVLEQSPPWFGVIDVAQHYELDLENRSGQTIDLTTWCEGLYVT